MKPGTRSPAPPFTTSTLQQEAYRKLGFSVSQTMAVAQKLYEAGKITYMRTDSTNLSKLALAKSSEVIVSEYGEKYSKTRQFKTKSKGAQEAHEAIRPAYPDISSITGNQNEKRLYELIWKRTIASQMADAEVERTTISIEMNNSPVLFSATGEVIKFDGFLKVYTESTDTENGDDEKSIIPPVKNRNASLSMTQLQPPRNTRLLLHAIQKPALSRSSRNLASEDHRPMLLQFQPSRTGVMFNAGRQAGRKTADKNYILSQKGNYSVTAKTEVAGKEKSKLFPQDIGMMVNDFLVENFSEIVDYNFTAEVEEQFDRIAEGKLKWTGMLEKFYNPFHKTVENALEKKIRKTGSRILGTHPETGEQVSVKMGRFGPVAQIGDTKTEENHGLPVLPRNQLLETITLEEALNLFRLPRSLGMHEGRRNGCRNRQVRTLCEICRTSSIH